MRLLERYIADAEEKQKEYYEFTQYLKTLNKGEDLVQTTSEDIRTLFLYLKLSELQEENEILKQECSDHEERLKEIERTLSKFDRY